MTNLRQSSFRRILLSRILLFSVPILGIGGVLAYRQVEAELTRSLQIQLHQNATLKAQLIQQAIAHTGERVLTLQRVLLESPTLATLATGQAAQSLGVSQILRQWSGRGQIQCLQVLAPTQNPAQNQAQTQPQPEQVLANSCNPAVQQQLQAALPDLPPSSAGAANPAVVTVLPLLSPPLTDSATTASVNPAPPTTTGQLALVLVVPLAATGASDRPNTMATTASTTVNRPYRLLAYAQLPLALLDNPSNRTATQPPDGWDTMQTMVVDQQGRLLGYSNPLLVDGAMQVEGDAGDGLRQQLVMAIANPSRPLLLRWSQNGQHWLSGYTMLQLTNAPLANSANPSVDPQSRSNASLPHQWLLLSVVRSEAALLPLQYFRQTLALLLVVFLVASLGVSIALGQEFGEPLHRLRRYAKRIEQEQKSIPLPQNFQIWEYNYLARSFNRMLKQVMAHSAELEVAWQEAMQANRSKNQFLANTSHELRTPLTAIIGSIQLVKEGICDNRQEEVEFLQRAEDASIHLLQIINDLLDVAKIEAGKLALVMEPVDLHQVLKDVIGMKEITLHQKGLGLTVATVPQALPVLADEAKLKQVLLNVIGNAIKFTEAGEIRVAVRVEQRAAHPVEIPQPSTPVPKPQGTVDELEDAGEFPVLPVEPEDEVRFPWAIVTVQDTGIGIPLDQQTKLFQPFATAEHNAHYRAQSTGLGLSICKNLIKLMGGTITLHSEGEGCGTTIEVVLPLLQPEDEFETVG